LRPKRNTDFTDSRAWNGSAGFWPETVLNQAADSDAAGLRE
jgi:hypothetical protein